MSFDLAEDKEKKTLEVNFPAVSLGRMSSEGRKVLSHRVVFDTDAGTLLETETVSISADGVKTSEKEVVEYQDFEGSPIPSARTVTIVKEDPRRLDISDREIPQIDDLSEIPMLTPEELEQLQESGAQISSYDPLIGDPTSLNSIEIYREVYENIELNTLENDFFRLTAR